jgi:hypothetical protein
MNIQEFLVSTFTIVLALVFGFLLIQTLMYAVTPVDRGVVTVDVYPEKEAPPWSYKYRYENWAYGLPGMRGPHNPLPPSSPYLPGVGRVYKV